MKALAKDQAKTLTRRAKELGIELKHTHALELLAALEGKRSREVKGKHQGRSEVENKRLAFDFLSKNGFSDNKFIDNMYKEATKTEYKNYHKSQLVWDKVYSSDEYNEREGGWVHFTTKPINVDELYLKYDFGDNWESIVDEDILKRLDVLERDNSFEVKGDKIRLYNTLQASPIVWPPEEEGEDYLNQFLKQFMESFKESFHKYASEGTFPRSNFKLGLGWVPKADAIESQELASEFGAENGECIILQGLFNLTDIDYINTAKDLIKPHFEFCEGITFKKDTVMVLESIGDLKTQVNLNPKNIERDNPVVLDLEGWDEYNNGFY